MQIKDYRHDYHRNGMGGEGSYVAFFRARLDRPHGWTPMMAVLWGCDGDDPPTECMAMALADVSDVAALYLNGETPESFGDKPYDAVKFDAWRSTDHFLRDLIPHWKRTNEANWERTLAAIGEARDERT